MRLSALDFGLIGFLLIGSLVAGLVFSKVASRSLERYFLGGREMPWWLLGLSGGATFFDISGTVWQVSMLALFGFSAVTLLYFPYMSLFAIPWMAFMGMWIRRTGVMTAAELMAFRFGTGPGGKMARTAAAVMVLLFLTISMGFAFVGAGKFAGPLLGMEDNTCALVLLLGTALYSVAGGFSGVVASDFFQTLLIILSAALVAVLAWWHVDVSALHAAFSTTLLTPWSVEGLPKGYESYESFGMIMLSGSVVGFLVMFGGAGGSVGEQRFLACRNESEAAKAAMIWGVMHLFRYAMIAGVVFLGIVAVGRPDDPERLFSFVLVEKIPDGVRGLLVAGMIAAFMSTVSSWINAGSSLAVRDLIQPFKPKWSEKRLVRSGYVASILMVGGGVLAGLNADSINHIWVWLIMGLNGSFVLPNFLRWYWGRLNGWGYSLGTLCGFLTSLIALLVPETPEFVYSPLVVLASLVGCLVGSFATRPVPVEVLDTFYRNVRPRGLWGSVRRRLSIAPANSVIDRGPRILLNLGLATGAIGVGNLVPMYFIGHWYTLAILSLGISVSCWIVLYFTWWKCLPSPTTLPILQTQLSSVESHAESSYITTNNRTD